MNIKGFRRMPFSEKMPDKNDPKYEGCYERGVDAGRRSVKATHIDKAVVKVQDFANAHRTLFPIIVFGFAIRELTWDIYRLTVVYRHHPVHRTTTKMQDSVLQERHKILPVLHVRRFDTKEGDIERPE